MIDFTDLIIGDLVVYPEIRVLVSLVGVLFALEIITCIVAFLGGLRR